MLLPSARLSSNFPSETFEIIRQGLRQSEILPAHKNERTLIGNLSRYHKNLSGLIAVKPTSNIHQAVSKILFGSIDKSEIIQLACYQLIRENQYATQECLNWTNNKNASYHEAKINTLLNITLPNQLSLAILARVIERNIILHIGSYCGGITSLKFGDYPHRLSVQLLELNKKIYPLFQVEGQINTTMGIPVIPANKCASSLRKWMVQDPSYMDFREFGEGMAIFFEVCSFCKDFGIRKDFNNRDETAKCTHLSNEHVKSFVRIRELLQDKKYGSLVQSDIPSSDLDTNSLLPENLSKKFCMIKTPTDGQCLFSACSYALSKQFHLAIPFRSLYSS